MDMGIEDYEPKVVSQLLEFIYRYATSIAEDAKMFSTHAKKKLIDPGNYASCMKVDWNLIIKVMLCI